MNLEHVYNSRDEELRLGKAELEIIISMDCQTKHE